MNLVMPEPNTGCWIWIGRTNYNGYGMCGRQKDSFEQLAHRHSFFLHNGKFDRINWVLHKCDNPFCVNPDHLYLGNAQQNNIDRDTRGRQKTKRGTEHKLAKLNESQVLEIRKLHNPKVYPTRKLALMYGVSQRKIMHILHRQSWAHI
jgi:hypothetical protein